MYLAAQHGDDLVEHPHSLPFPGLVNPRRLKPLEQPKDPGVYDDITHGQASLPRLAQSNDSTHGDTGLNTAPLPSS